MQSLLFLIAPLLLAVACHASYDPYIDMAQLYRMQLLANAFDEYSPESQLMDRRSDVDDASAYWPEMDSLAGGPADDDMSIYNDALYGGPHLRDEEHLEHSALHGYQSVSGGSGEVKENAKEVKTDKQLPAYCNPPNPCPVGKTEKDNCVENFENSADNNQRLLSKQKCPCDTEHMFTCPAGSQTVSSKASDSNQQMALNKVIDELSNMEHNDDSMEGNSILSPTRKRITLIAKKSPHFIRKRSEYVGAEENPHLKGNRIQIAAKKSPEYSKNAFSLWLDEQQVN